MDKEISLSLILPSKVYLEEKAGSVVLPAIRAAVDILPDRAPSVFVLDFGVLQVLNSNGSLRRRYFIQSGMAEVADNECKVMVQGIVPFDEMNPVEAKKRIETAVNMQERLFYQMILDHQLGIRRRYLRTLKLFSRKKGRLKTRAEVASDLKARQDHQEKQG